MKSPICLFSFLGVLFGLASSAQTDITGSFIFDGLTRTYRVHIPGIYTAANPVPLILGLHGYGSNGLEQELYTQFNPIADTANFIIVYPDGTQDGLGNTFWNAFSLGDAADDIGFLSALIDTLSDHFSIDPNRIYSTGMSNGGFMSYELACHLSHRIAAIASVTGSMTTLQQSQCQAQHPTPVMQIHGTADGTVSYNGTFGVPSIEDLVQYWANFNHCNPTPNITELPDINTTDNCTAEHIVYTGGDAGSSVEFYKIIGGDHSWPGSPVNLNTTNMDFNASQEIWRFFRQYKLNLLTGITPPVPFENNEWFRIFPNPAKGSVNLYFSFLGKKEIVIVDTLGKIVFQENVTSEKAQISLVESGIFFVAVTDECGARQTQKIIFNQ